MKVVTEKIKNIPSNDNIIKKRILMDCTDIVLRNQSSGIQRVVKNLYFNLSVILNKNDFEVLPVYLKNGRVFRVNLKELQKGNVGNTENESNSIFRDIVRRTAEKVLPYISYKIIYFLQRKLFEQRLNKNIIGNQFNFIENDILILADASWRVNIWKSLYQAQDVNAKIIPVIHDLIPIYHTDLVRSCYSKIFNQWLIGLYKLTDDFICVSESVKNDLMRFYKSKGLNIENKHFDSFTLGADFKQNIHDSKIVSNSIIELFQNYQSVYLVVSTIEPRKNHDFLLDVFNVLWDDGLDVTLCIVGKDIGTASKTIQRIKTHHLINKKLFMFNSLTDNEVVYCYEHSKALLLPSIAEGFGLPIVEAMNYSLPVLASDTSVFREVGKDNIHYFSIASTDDLTDKIKQIEIDKLKLLKNTKFEKIHSWEESAKQLIELINVLK